MCNKWIITCGLRELNKAKEEDEGDPDVDGQMIKSERAIYSKAMKWALEVKTHMMQFNWIQQTIQLMDG